ncbi:MAG: PH domain-containing protein [Lachnospiraceae bacterium]|nr:PH domain-containing protein [Lachnospiraceae bacterium]
MKSYYSEVMWIMEYIERKRWLFFGLPFTFTKYTIREDMITISEGLLKTVENDCYMYKVQDVAHTATLIEKMFGLGTVICYTGDTTHPQLIISHVRNSREIKEFILRESEEARIKRRTVNMLDIGSGDISDLNGDADDM